MRLFLILAALLGFALYGIALQAPLYLDDSVVLGISETLHWGPRAIGFNSFWLSHRLADWLALALPFQVTVYYRLPNILIHIFAATAVFWLTREVTGRRLSAGFAGALFLMHPVQTQAVTYVTQRFESLAALFIIVAGAAYVRFRKGGSIHWLWVVAAAGLAAGRTKETGIVLLLWIPLIEIVLITGTSFLRTLPRWVYLVLLVLAVAISYPAYLAFKGSQQTLVWIPFEYYWLTQGEVLFQYLRLIVLPDRQFLLYGTRAAMELTAVLTLKWLVVLSVAGLGVYLSRRKPVVGFGILTFFLMLGPTSVAPIPDLIFEHRVYPAFAGMAIAIGCAFRPNRRTAALFAVLLIALGVRTVMRNDEWNDRVSFFEAHRREFPEDSKSLASLGTAYAVRGEVKKAIEVNQAARKYLPQINAYYLRSITIITDMNLALLYLQSGNTRAAREEALRVLSINPEDTAAMNILGNVQEADGDMEAARATYEKINRINPGNEGMLMRLAGIDSVLGYSREAEEARNKAKAAKTEAAEREERRRPSAERQKRIVYGLVVSLLVILVFAGRALFQDLPEVLRWIRTGRVLREGSIMNPPVS